MSAAWQESSVALDGTHHVSRGQPLYDARFLEVLSFHAPGLASARDASGAFHIDETGRPVYGRRFRRTFGFYEGRATVEDETGAHHIDAHGEDVGTNRFAWCGNFQGERCTVRDRDGRYFHVDQNDQPVYSERWRYAGDFREGAAVVQDGAGLHHHINAEGQRVETRDFLDLDVFHKGFARARDLDGWHHIRWDGTPAYSQRFAAVEPFYNGQARCEAFDGSLLVIDETGREIVRLREARHSAFAALSGDLVGFWRTQTIAAAVELGVPDALPGTIEEITARTRLPFSSTKRLLRALGELGVLARVGEAWAQTAKGAFLQTAGPLSLAHAALEYAGGMTERWTRLPDALRRGDSWSPPDFFAEAATRPELRVAHHRTLAAYAHHDYGPLADAIDAGRHELLVDAGGGHGVLVTMLLERYPHVSAVLFDRPEVLEQAEIPATLAGRVTRHAADFFEPWPVRADAIVLTRILHDWNDGAAVRLLQQARAALRPCGRLYVAEMLLDEAGHAGGLCDLHLLAVTGGRERTAAHYQRLLEEAGFSLVEVRALPSIVSLLIAEARR